MGLSQVFAFTAAPEVSADTSVSVLLIADMGQGEPDGSMEQSEMVPSLDTTQWMIHDAFGGQDPDQNPAAQYQLVGHFGDISYARGHVSQWDRCSEFLYLCPGKDYFIVRSFFSLYKRHFGDCWIGY